MKVLGLATLLLAAGLVEMPISWLHNPHERTETGLDAWDRGDLEAAATAMDQALEAAGDTPSDLVRFNAGTARLGAGDATGAVELLGQEPTAAELTADARYNLGNAHLVAGEPAAALAAYRESLLAEPDRTDAKHNLELALRLLQQQQQEQDEQEEGDEADADQQDSSSEGETDEQEESDPEPSDGSEAGEESEPDPSSSSLPDFRPQEDMTPEQAAALLEAVENLERQQRQAQAEEERRRQAGQAVVEHDW